MDLALILPPDGPRGARLVEALREAIVSGRLAAGAKLPPSRLLAAQLNVSRGTVVAAYEELVSEGYCAARVGAGTFVAVSNAPAPPRSVLRQPRLSVWGERLAQFPPRPFPRGEALYDFRYGVTPEAFPEAALTRALRRSAESLTAERGPGEAGGSARLRAALTAHLGRTRGLRADPSQMIIVSGSQQGLDLVSRLLLDAGDRVCLEDPAYPRMRTILLSLGAEIVPVPVDSGGLMPERLPEDGVRMAYVTPSHQHPTGSVLMPERRLALLRWAERSDAWLLEDDYDSEFRYGGPPLPCLQGLDRAGLCIYVGSLSKLLHPALRAGYVVVPPALVPAALAAKASLDHATTPVIQEAMADLFESGEIERHLRRAGRAYRARRAHLLAALARWPLPGARVWSVTGGLHAFVELPQVEPLALRRAAAAEGLALSEAEDTYLTPRSGAAIVLWFGRIPLERIGPGITALQRAVLAAGAVPEPRRSAVS